MNFLQGLKNLPALLVLLCSICANSLSWSATTASPGGWVRQDPFSDHVFIENAGQLGPQMADVKYLVRNGEETIFFTTSGMVTMHCKFPGTTGEEDRENAIIRTERAGITWKNISPGLKIIAREPVDFYFTYRNGKSGFIKASGYKKIVYQDIYPGIDIEYSIPGTRGEIKYTVLLHPGADADALRIQFSGYAPSLDRNGNLHLAASFGELTDQAPTAFNKNTGEKIPCYFRLNGQEAGFLLHRTRPGQEIIIDPLLINPNLNFYNAAYDVDYDLAGNVYVHGGGFPFEARKFNSSGNLVWIYTTYSFYNWQPSYYTQYYGDFAIDPNSGSAYIVEGIGNPGAGLIKLNAAGIPVASYNGNYQLREKWRVVFDNCNKQLIIAGGGNASNSCQACTCDTNLLNLVPVHLFNTTEAHHDMSLLALDNSGNCFMASSKSNTYPGNFNNLLLKCPAQGLLPVTWSVPDNYAFYELGINYPMNGNACTTGMNGMAVNDHYLFTYDGKTIRRWNKNTGALINSLQVSSGQPFQCGGIAADDCGNIYVGVQTVLTRFDSLFNASLVYAAPNRIFDVRLGPGNTLYTCGPGFAAVLPSAGPSCSWNLSAQVHDSCGQASAVVLSSGNYGPLTYSWTSSPSQSASTATGLQAGTYTVFVTDNSCIPRRDTQVVTVQPFQQFASVNGNSTVCSGQPVQLFSGGGFTSYSWSTGATGSAIVVIPVNTCTYTVMVTNANGCTDTASQTVIVNPVPPASISSADTICYGTYTTLHAEGGGSYLWSTGETGQEITVMPLANTTYSVTVSNGLCSASASAVVYVRGPTAQVHAEIIAGSFHQLSAQGGSSYTWSPPDGLSCVYCADPIANPAATTRYCVTVSDGSACKDSACVTVFVSTFYVPNAFTPNGNELNDVFKPVILGVHDYSFTIFNRWGEKIFETSNTEEGWNGCYKGIKCQEGVYVYRISFINDEDLNAREYVGGVSLIR